MLLQFGDLLPQAGHLSPCGCLLANLVLVFLCRALDGGNRHTDVISIAHLLRQDGVRGNDSLR